MSNNMYNGQHEAPTSTGGSLLYHEQPGLEVDSRVDRPGLQRDYYAGDTAKQVSPDEHQIPSGLQVATPGAAKEGGGYFSDRELYDAPGLEATPPPGGVNSNFGERGLPSAAATPATPKPNRRRLWIILGGIAALVVVLGAVLGGVLGSRAARSSSTVSEDQVGAGGSSSGGAGNSTEPRRTIRPGSSLAVTGWREGSGYHIRLFYQGPDQVLRFSNCSSTEAGWNKQPTLLDEMEYKAKPNTSLAAATSVENAKSGEWKLFYLDGSSTLRQQIFPADVKDTGKSGELNNYPQAAAPHSRLGAYWPFVLSQDVGGKLRWTRYWGLQGGKVRWDSSTDIDIAASAGSGLVVVPAAATYKDAGGLVYRRGDQKVYNYLADRMGNNTGFAWASGTYFFILYLFIFSFFSFSSSNLFVTEPCLGDIANNLKDLTIPQGSPLAAFTVARSPSPSRDGPDQFVNTYILYADARGAVQMVWQNDQSGWQGPRHYAAFDGAEAGTDLACLTPAAWDGSGVALAGAYDMSRCYFQAGGAGRVREVQFDGSDWTDRGYLPIE